MPERQVLKPRKLYEEPEELITLIPVGEIRAFLEAHPSTGDFKPTALYNREGDMIEVYFEDEPCYAETVGNFVVLRSQEDKRIVGVKIHCVKRLMGLSEIKAPPPPPETDEETKMSIAEQIALNAGKCLAWACIEKAGPDGYCTEHGERL